MVNPYVVNPEVDEAARLLAIADQYLRQANAARTLARTIERRRLMLKNRLDPCVQRHQPDVWSSAAAEISRARLTRTVARDLSIACDQLLETRTALIHSAEQAEAQAFVLQNRASDIKVTNDPNPKAGGSAPYYRSRAV